MMFEYLDMNNHQAVCDVEHCGNLIIATELRDNPGASVTNSCKQIAEQCCQKFGIKPMSLLFVERYDERSGSYHAGNRTTYDHVKMKLLPGGHFCAPEWTHLSPKELDRIKYMELSRKE